MLAAVAYGFEQFGKSDRASAVAIAAFSVALITGVSFALWPSLDIAVASLFLTHDHTFVGNTSVAVQIARNLFKLVFVVATIVAVFGLIITRVFGAPWRGIGFTGWMFFALCLVMGPGVVTNLAFKDQWGRARPSQIVELGGTQAFRAPLVVSDQCRRNCSFVSGEASSMFMVFFAAAFMGRRRHFQLMGAGLAAGGLAGLVRMAQGAHFLSDVIFAGVLMALTAALLCLAFRAIADGGRDDLPSGIAQQAG